MFRDFRTHPRAFPLNDVAEYFCRELFALIVTYHADLDFLFITEILVIMHLTCDEGISTLADSLVQQEITSPAAYGYTLNRTAQ